MGAVLEVVPRRRRRSGLAILSGAALIPVLAFAQAPQAPASAPTPNAPAKPVEGVTVKAAPQEAVRASIDRRSYSVANDLQGSNGSLADALRNVPGVQVDLNGNLTVRGARVRILIDGQPSTLFSGQNAGLALQAMTADRIDRVEVITNPGAEFSAEGQGGIINLVTKKSAPSGTTGAIRANLGTEGRLNGAGNISYVKGQLTLTADAGLGRGYQKIDSGTTGTVVDPATGQNDLRDTTNVNNGPLKSWNGHVSLEYRLDPKTQIVAEARVNSFSQERFYDSSLLTADPGGAPLAAYTRTGGYSNTQDLSMGQLTLRHQFPGQDHTLVLFFNHTQTNYRNEIPYTETFTAPPPTVTEFQDQFARTNTDVNEFKADYVRPMPDKAQLKAGYDLRVFNGVYNNFGAEGSGPQSASFNPIFANLFRYGQMVNAAYVSYEQPFHDLTVMGGLRLEDEQLNLGEISQNQSVRRNELGVFPSFHLGYNLSPTSQWLASYSSRIARPQPFALDPFRNLSDPFTIQMGNPDLKPAIAQSFETGWQYRRASTFYLAELFYRQNERGVTNVVTDLGGGALLITRENLSVSKNSGLELVASGPIGKTFTYNASTDIYYNQVTSPILGVTQTRQELTASARASLNWNPTKIDLVQFNGTVNAAQQSPQGHSDPLVIMFFGYRHKFTDRFAITGQLQDPFGLIHLNSYIDSNGIDQHTSTRIGFRAAFIGFTYAFGGSGRPARDPGFDFNPGAAAAGEP